MIQESKLEIQQIWKILILVFNDILFITCGLQFFSEHVWAFEHKNTLEKN